MTSEERRRRLEAHDQEFIAGYPPALQPLARQFVEARHRTARAMTLKHRARRSGEDQALVQKWEATVRGLRGELVELEGRLQNELLEYRVAEFSPDKQDRARAILVSQKEALRHAIENPPQELREAASEASGLSKVWIQHHQALKRGDEAGAAELKPKLDELLAAKRKEDRLSDMHRLYREEIRAQFERQLEDLRHD